MNEAELIERFKHILEGERLALQNQLRTKLKYDGAISRQDMRDMTYRVRYHLNAIHPDANRLVDTWVEAVAQQVRVEGRVVWKGKDA